MDHNIWGKSVTYFKGKTTRKKHIPMADDLVQVPEEMVKLHRDIYLAEDLLFVNSIPLFINLSRKICFTSVNHLPHMKLDTILKDFKDIYSYCMKHGFHITTIHADGYFPH